MKKANYFPRLFSSILILVLAGCIKDEDKTVKNRAPESFQLTEENFTVMYNGENETVNIDWPSVKDPDGDQVNYQLKVNGTEKASSLGNSEAELAATEFTDLMAEHTFEITATDPDGLTSTASAVRSPFPNGAPPKPGKVTATPTFYGAELSWEPTTDPDGNSVYYSIEIGGTTVAEGVEGTSFIVRGYNEETTHKATVKAVDEFGAESEGQAVEFTILKKETISSPTVTVNVWGVVVNENGEAVQDATVKIEAQEQKTNERGWFIFNEITVSESRAMLTVTAPNYFKSFKTLKIADGKTNSQRIELLPKTIIGTVNAADGGEVSSDEGMKIALPENAFSDYNGEVKVATRLMDPTDEDFGFQNPGLEAFNTQGEYGALQSFGMAAIEMQDANGNELQLKAGKQATLTFPVPEELGEFAPEVIPLWAFDEEQNIWVEEGRAELINGVYVGKVGHFSIWNADLFRESGEICFTVLDKNGRPITNAYVEIILENGMVGSGFTNENGEVCTFMPAGASFSLNVSIGGAGGRQCNIITGQKGEGVPFGTGKVSRIIKAQGGQELYVSIEGTATDCNDAPLKNSFVVIRDPQDNAILGGFTDETGKFFLQGLHCFPVDGNESNRIEVIAYDFTSNKYSKPQEFRVVSNHIISEEPFKACQDDIPAFGENGGEGRIYKGDVTFKNNQEVIEFVSKGYTGIDGYLHILGGQVTDISAFKDRLLTVTGNIKIEKTGLTSLSDLSGITAVGNSIYIQKNDKLQSIGDGFSKLKELVYLTISENKVLQSIDGFNEVEKAKDTWNISKNDALQTINGFNKLKEVNTLWIFTNNALHRIDGFNEVEKVGKADITDNSELQAITGFSKIKEVEYLTISNNKTLQNIDGFSKIEKVGNWVILNNSALQSINEFGKLKEIKNLSIYNNGALQSITGFNEIEKAEGLGIIGNGALQGITGFSKLKEIGELKIENNKVLPIIDGFNALEKAGLLLITSTIDVELKSITGFANLRGIFKTSYLENKLVISAPKLESITGFQKMVSGGKFEISGPKLMTITGFQNMTDVEWFRVTYLSLIEDLSAFENIQGHVKNFTISRCPNLKIIPDFNKIKSVDNLYLTDLAKITNLRSFNGLESVEDLIINRNDFLKVIDGFNNLTTFKDATQNSERLSISYNNKLTKIDGFNKLQTVENVEIISNDTLSNYCGIPKVFWDPKGSIQKFELKGNSYNPTREELFNGACKQ